MDVKEADVGRTLVFYQNPHLLAGDDLARMEKHQRKEKKGGKKGTLYIETFMVPSNRAQTK